MASCDYCGTTILFGGVSTRDQRYCNEDCHHAGYMLSIASQIPKDVLEKKVREMHQSACPHCDGPGPIDVHTSYVVYSFMVITSWKSRQKLCCRRCGVKSQIGGALISAVAGWWGFPWGIFLTPVQIIRNINGIFYPPKENYPSAELENIVKIQLASYSMGQN
jgi:hypothetical protein